MQSAMQRLELLLPGGVEALAVGRLNGGTGPRRRADAG
jgi:hypothetical protein